MVRVSLWARKKHFRHLERSYLLLVCGIGYDVVKLSNVNSSVTCYTS